MRPKKNGLDYFSLDVTFSDEVNLIDAKYGCEGLCILIKLWQIIYENGYFINWSERELLLYKTRINADINLINDVINECLKWNIFSEKLYKKYGILTSSGIQKRFIEATQRRSEIEFIGEYLIIKNIKNMYPRKNKNGEFIVNVVINKINDVNNSENDVKSTQRERESKEKEKVKRKRKRKYKKIYVETSPEYLLSKLLFSEMQKNNPQCKEPDMQNWALAIDRMIRLDKRSIDDIRNIIIFSQGNDFWKTNILSTSKLRKQFDALWLQWNQQLEKEIKRLGEKE